MKPEEQTLEETNQTRAWLEQQAATLNDEKAALLEERENLTDEKHIRTLYGDALMGRIDHDALRQRRDRLT